jgi:hypothetical protein
VGDRFFGSANPFVPFLLLRPPFFLIILFFSTTLLTEMTVSSFHRQFPHKGLITLLPILFNYFSISTGSTKFCYLLCYFSKSKFITSTPVLQLGRYTYIYWKKKFPLENLSIIYQQTTKKYCSCRTCFKIFHKLVSFCLFKKILLWLFFIRAKTFLIFCGNFFAKGEQDKIRLFLNITCSRKPQFT